MPVVVARDVAARNFGIRHAFGELFDVAFRRKVDDVAAENREFAAALFRAIDVERYVVARLSERARAGLFFSVCAAAFPPKNAAARVAAVFARVLLFIGKIFFFPRLEIRQR